MRIDPAIELLSRLSPAYATPVADLRQDLRATDIELRALADTLRIDHGINVVFRTEPHNTGRISHLTLSRRSWAKAQSVAADYEKMRDLIGAA